MKICTPLSQLLPVKNVEGVFRAVALLRDGSVFINVVGGGDFTGLERLARRLKIEGQVKFWGGLPNPQAMEALQKSDVFVLNSFHEGLPHALLEALSNGIPVVATKIPAFLEVLKDRETAILVKAGDDEDLARGILEACKFKKELIINGVKLYKKKFTWGVHLKQLYNLFDEVISGVAPGGHN